ncbi:hypothetical protein QC761_700870 [Podospora bellae-mahoneyi]|uniref:Uncharacterized protein n=1 Tax=Podospora bellae-mahoneyi TaxID=2093777 RepID=A0ABR0F7B0_9PEZI|nr:hypothetical protein QC761_700870 [Podospora bellae-mahoneyi]
MSSPSYKRVCLLRNEDATRCSKLVLNWLKNPDAALLVEEFIVDPPQRFGHFMNGEPDPALDDGDHELVVKYIESLGVSDNMKTKILEGVPRKKDKAKSEVHTQDDEPPAKRIRWNSGWPDVPHYHEALAILVISLCPNIKRLRFNPETLILGTLLDEYLVQNNYGEITEPTLQRLEVVHVEAINHCLIDGCNYDTVRSLGFFRYFHRLPSVSTVKIEAISDYQPDNTSFPPKSSSTISKITIGHSDISGAILSSIIRIPQALTHFSFSNAGLWNTDGAYTYDVKPKTVSKCLLQHKDSLQVLDLDARLYDPSKYDKHHPALLEHQKDEYPEYYYGRYASSQSDTGRGRGRTPPPDAKYLDLDRSFSGEKEEDLPLYAVDLPDTFDYEGGSIGSLKDFTKLTDLSIRIGNILGYDDTCKYKVTIRTLKHRLVDLLPPNLESLKLYGYEKGKFAQVDAHVDELLAQKQEKLPNLKTIHGLDECILGVAGTYPAELGNSELWQRPCEGLNWVEVETDDDEADP